MTIPSSHNQPGWQKSGVQNFSVGGRTTVLIASLAFAFWIQSPPLELNTNAGTVNQKFVMAKDARSSCAQMDFPPRNSNDDIKFIAEWKKSVQFVVEHQLTFLEASGISFHREKLHEIESKGLSGMIIECGVAKAGSSITIAAYKHPNRCLHLFDTFEGIPTPSGKDGEDVMQRYRDIQHAKEACQKGLPECDKSYYGNMDNLLEYDISQFELSGYPAKDNSVYFHKGLFDDTVWPAGPIAYAHLVRTARQQSLYTLASKFDPQYLNRPSPNCCLQDGDWYDSTYNMLQRLSPHLVDGGYFVLDDVYQWSGAKNAFQDFFEFDLVWLDQQANKKCLSLVNDRMFLVALEIRATAQALKPNLGIVSCKRLGTQKSS